MPQHSESLTIDDHSMVPSYSTTSWIFTPGVENQSKYVLENRTESSKRTDKKVVLASTENGDEISIRNSQPNMMK